MLYMPSREFLVNSTDHSDAIIARGGSILVMTRFGLARRSTIMPWIIELLIFRHYWFIDLSIYRFSRFYLRLEPVLEHAVVVVVGDLQLNIFEIDVWKLGKREFQIVYEKWMRGRELLRIPLTDLKKQKKLLVQNYSNICNTNLKHACIYYLNGTPSKIAALIRSRLCFVYSNEFIQHFSIFRLFFSFSYKILWFYLNGSPSEITALVRSRLRAGRIRASEEVVELGRLGAVPAGMVDNELGWIELGYGGLW